MIHPPAVDNYRVIYDDVEIGSIGIQLGLRSETFWSWGIDTVLPLDGLTMDGTGQNCEDCQRQFKDAFGTSSAVIQNA